MTKFIVATMTALFLAVVATPVASIATATEASAWPKKKCTDWCTNRNGQKFRIGGH